MGPNCPHCGADLGRIGFVAVESVDEDQDDELDDGDELIDDEGPE